MQCDEARELLSPYLDGELTPEQRLVVDSHLVECADCAAELVDFESISGYAARMVDPVPPADLWDRIDGQMVGSRTATEPLPEQRRRSRRKIATVIVAALLLVGTGLTVALMQWHGAEHHDTLNLDQYLTEFARDPNVAQNSLLSKYENQEVDIREATAQLGYQPVAAGRLPDGVSVKAIRVFDMPCCRCIQTICTVDKKQTVVIYEHADEHAFEFGDRRSMTCQCKGHKTRIVKFDGQMVASWAKGRRHLTLVGARDLSQVVQFVERLK